MNKVTILKITGILLVPFLIMLGGVFFLYPHMNEEKYNEIVETFEQQQEESFNEGALSYKPGDSKQDTVSGTFSDSVATQASMDSIGVDTAYIAGEVESMGQSLNTVEMFEENEIRLHGVIDSLYVRIDQLEQLVDSLQNPIEENNELDPTEFADRVKSLLNLEEEELGPILKNMTKGQIVRLYNGGGTIQRQKILRSMEADKAAELMTEIML